MNEKDEQSVKPRFDTINDVVSDPYFIKLVDDEIDKLIKARKIRPEPKSGFYYKRDWYDRMSRGSELNANFFIKNIPLIWVKKSNLSSEKRNVIRIICDKAARETVLYYEKLFKPIINHE